MGILVSGMSPFDLGQHFNLESIPVFRQAYFDFTAYVLLN